MRSKQTLINYQQLVIIMLKFLAGKLTFRRSRDAYSSIVSAASCLPCRRYRAARLRRVVVTVGLTKVIRICAYKIHRLSSRSGVLICAKLLCVQITLTKLKTRRHSESAYIRQVNFFTAFIQGWGGRWCPVKTESLSRAVFEITGLKDTGITTLTSEGHVTSSITSSFDPP